MTSREQCEHCKSTFQNKTILKTHINTNKKCLASRGLSLQTKFICEGCNTMLITVSHLHSHYEICKEYIISKLLQKHEKELQEQREYYEKREKEQQDHYEKELKDKIKHTRNTCDSQYKNLKDEYELDLNEKEKQYELLKLSFDHVQSNYNNLKEEYTIKINKYEAILERLAMDAVNKPISTTTTTNNTVNNIVRDHLSTVYTIDSLTDKQIEERIRSCMTEKIFWEGQKGLAKMCVDSIVKTPDNKLMLCCTDTSRGKFKLFDVKGNLKEDIDARLFTDRVGKYIKIVGNEIRETIQEHIDNKSNMLEEKNGREKDELLHKMEQLGYALFDVVNVDDYERNKVFRSELAVLSSVKRGDEI